MLGTNGSKNGIRSYALGNYRTLLLIALVHKTLCFSFEAFRAVKLLQQIQANLMCGYFKGSTFFDTPCMFGGFMLTVIGCEGRIVHISEL